MADIRIINDYRCGNSSIPNPPWSPSVFQNIKDKRYLVLDNSLHYNHCAVHFPPRKIRNVYLPTWNCRSALVGSYGNVALSIAGKQTSTLQIFLSLSDLAGNCHLRHSDGNSQS